MFIGTLSCIIDNNIYTSFLLLVTLSPRFSFVTPDVLERTYHVCLSYLFMYFVDVSLFQTYLTYFEVQEDGSVKGQMSKHLNTTALSPLCRDLDLKPGDTVFVSAGQDYIPVSCSCYFNFCKFYCK